MHVRIYNLTTEVPAGYLNLDVMDRIKIDPDVGENFFQLTAQKGADIKVYKITVSTYVELNEYISKHTI